MSGFQCCMLGSSGFNASTWNPRANSHLSHGRKYLGLEAADRLANTAGRCSEGNDGAWSSCDRLESALAALMRNFNCTSATTDRIAWLRRLGRALSHGAASATTTQYVEGTIVLCG